MCVCERGRVVGWHVASLSHAARGGHGARQHARAPAADGAHLRQRLALPRQQTPARRPQQQARAWRLAAGFQARPRAAWQPQWGHGHHPVCPERAERGGGGGVSAVSHGPWCTCAMHARHAQSQNATPCTPTGTCASRPDSPPLPLPLPPPPPSSALAGVTAASHSTRMKPSRAGCSPRAPACVFVFVCVVCVCARVCTSRVNTAAQGQTHSTRHTHSTHSTHRRACSKDVALEAAQQHEQQRLMAAAAARAAEGGTQPRQHRAPQLVHDLRHNRGRERRDLWALRSRRGRREQRERRAAATAAGQAPCARLQLRQARRQRPCRCHPACCCCC
jgi:hypothetical protein